MRATLPGWTLAAAGLLAAAPADAAAQTYRTLSASRQRVNEEHLTVHVQFAAGTFQLLPDLQGALYRARVVYDEERFEPVSRFDRSANELHIGVSGEGLRGGVGRSGLREQRLELAIAPDVPLALDLELGAVEADLRLGGLSIREARMRMGASQTTVWFDAPNGVACERLEMEVGAAEFTLHGLGNARCEHVSLQGGAGDFTLDLGGSWDVDGIAAITIEVGVAAVKLRIPRNLGVELEVHRFLAAFERSGFTKRGSSYYSNGYDTATRKISLDISTAIGDIDVEWTERQ